MTIQEYIENVEFLEDEELNRQLFEAYPWMKAEEFDVPMFEYIPVGWRKGFGMQLIEELQAAYEELTEEEKEEFFFVQIKEKYGSLRMYPSIFNNTISNIVNKYEKLSEQTCIHCGKPGNEYWHNGWVAPFCQDHYEQFFGKEE